GQPALRGRGGRALAVRARPARRALARPPLRDRRTARSRSRRARLAHGGASAPLGGDDDGAPLRAGCDMVTEELVWEALASVPDPEIPVVSVVDLGVVREVGVLDGSVRIEFTPTFLGCPALEAMRDGMAAAVRKLGAEPEIEVVLDDSCSTDRITPERRRKLRAS